MNDPLPPNLPDKTRPNFLDPFHSPVNDHDLELFERELRTFLPSPIFDVHAHLYDPAHLGSEGPAVGYEAYRLSLSSWMGDLAPPQGLYFPYPARNLDTIAANRFLLEQVQRAGGSRGLAILKPGDRPEDFEELLGTGNCAGFKVYHVFADRADTMNSVCEEFIPEWAWEMADQKNLCLMLHLVLPRALADERNQSYIRARCRDFPGARLILAHAARGFCGRHTLEGLDAIRGLENVIFDTSAICEPEPLSAILRIFGTTRLLYGSDFPVSAIRGRPVSIGDGFCWLYDHLVDLDGWELGQLTLVGIESLLALKQACRECHLKDSDLERIFAKNARDLLGLTPVEDSDPGQELYARAKKIIPGGTQLLSKRPELYAPGKWPSYYAEAKGCEVVDLSGRRFLDFTTSGIGACLLGYGDPDVDAAVSRVVLTGSASTLNCPAEVELCEALVELHPWADNVRLARTGGESMAIAIRIARAATGRDTVAFCGYHGWTDWYLAANLGSSSALDDHLLPGLPSRGVPRGLEGTALPFSYNRLDQLEEIVSNHSGTLAAVVLEPTRSVNPAPGFLEGVRVLCEKSGAVMVFDEVSTGFRFHRGGVHLRYGVFPDLAVFAKALGNGYPIGAILGRGSVMQAASRTFISSTSWTEGIGSAAGLTTLRKMQEVDVPAHVAEIGTAVRTGLDERAETTLLPLRISGHPALTYLKFDHPLGEALMTLYTIRMLERGFLAGSSFYPTWAHQIHHVERFLAEVEPVFAELAESLERGDTRDRIGGLEKQPPFARLT